MLAKLSAGKESENRIENSSTACHAFTTDPADEIMAPQILL